MPPNLLEYHKSINSEFDVLKNRVRHLIGEAHWPSDGEQKEIVLRKVLGNHIAESLRISRGFICYPNGSPSKQIDVLITDRSKPTLFQEGDRVFVTPDAVKAIIEVKTDENLTELREAAGILSEQIERVREYNTDCLAGLFAFGEAATNHNTILTAIREKSQGKKERVINWCSLGPEIFIRFWQEGTQLKNRDIENDTVLEDSWYSYQLRDLGQAYFVSNVVWDTASNNVHEMQSLWFPIEGGKERYRQAHIALAGGEVHEF